MRLESGKYYETRDGRKAYVDSIVGVNPFGGTECNCPVMGFIDEHGASSWDTTGKWIDKGSSSRDLVAEWREPEEYTVWLRKDSTGYIYAEMSNDPNDEVLAKVTVKEGEGL